jgi:hypothetical protein
MGQEPYKSARRVFWIMDNCSAHRGQKAANRLRDRWPNVILIYTPVHASWLNQVEIYLSIVQKKRPHAQRLLISAGTPTTPICLSVPLRAVGIALQLDLTRRDLNALPAKIDLKRLAPAA